MKLPRLHLFEFTDQRWLPRALREDLLAIIDALLSPSYVQASHSINRVLIETGRREILDIGSGHGSHWPHLISDINDNNPAKITVTLSDIIPLKNPSEAIQKEDAISCRASAFDATDHTVDAAVMLTFFSVFHHFRPKDAIAVLGAAGSHHNPFVIVEVVQRRWVRILQMPLSFVALFFIMPRLKSFGWRRFVFTYLVPLLPIMYLWDAIVSHLRAYEPAEIYDMAQAAGLQNYKFNHVRLQSDIGLQAVTIFVGRPAKSAR
jgi:hypothetical protein